MDSERPHASVRILGQICIFDDTGVRVVGSPVLEKTMREFYKNYRPDGYEPCLFLAAARHAAKIFGGKVERVVLPPQPGSDEGVVF